MTRTQRLARAAVPLLLATLVAYELATGRIYLYIHDRSTWLVALSVPVLLALAVVALKPSMSSIGGRGWWLALVPFVLAALIPARPLGAAALDARGSVTTALPAGSAGLPLDQAPLELTPMQQVWDIKQLGLLDPSQTPAARLDGQRADVIGFVHRADGLDSDEFQVGRFLVRCCTADAVAVTVPVRYAHAADLRQDTWVDVEGILRANTAAAQPVLEADSVRVVDEPARPYVQLP